MRNKQRIKRNPKIEPLIESRVKEELEYKERIKRQRRTRDQQQRRYEGTSAPRWVKRDGEELGEKAVGYSEYLKTSHWQEVRKSALDYAKDRCQVCNGKNKLNVHHRNYKTMWSETGSDVVVLCITCHGLFHERGRLL
jgi:hypothetical protein